MNTQRWQVHALIKSVFNSISLSYQLYFLMQSWKYSSKTSYILWQWNIVHNRGWWFTYPMTEAWLSTLSHHLGYYYLQNKYWSSPSELDIGSWCQPPTTPHTNSPCCCCSSWIIKATHLVFYYVCKVLAIWKFLR